jgi:hypothetical protein
LLGRECEDDPFLVLTLSEALLEMSLKLALGSTIHDYKFSENWALSRIRR